MTSNSHMIIQLEYNINKWFISIKEITAQMPLIKHVLPPLCTGFLEVIIRLSYHELILGLALDQIPFRI